MLTKYKSPANDQISAELIQAGGNKLRSESHKRIISIWKRRISRAVEEIFYCTYL
jgi:hypothetical protein